MKYLSIFIIFTTLSVITVVYQSHKVRPRTPELLVDVKAKGGWNSACPPPKNMVQFVLDGSSSELTNRLANLFPPGSDPTALVNKLILQGFTIGENCPNDETIHRAFFSQTGSLFWGAYPISASVAWRLRSNGTLDWTKGYVSFNAP